MASVELGLTLSKHAVRVLDEYAEEHPLALTRSGAFRDLVDQTSRQQTREIVEMGRVPVERYKNAARTIGGGRENFAEYAAEAYTKENNDIDIDANDVYNVRVTKDGENVVLYEMNELVPPRTHIIFENHTPPGVTGRSHSGQIGVGDIDRLGVERIYVTVSEEMAGMMDQKLQAWRDRTPDSVRTEGRLTRRTVAEAVIRDVFDLGWPPEEVLDPPVS